MAAVLRQPNGMSFLIYGLFLGEGEAYRHYCGKHYEIPEACYAVAHYAGVDHEQ